MEQGGFEFVSNQPQPANRGRGGGDRGRGGRGGRGRGGGDRGGNRGGRGGLSRGGGAPRGGRTDADGNPIQSANRPRRDGPAESRRGDRQDKSGRGRRGGRKDGHGRGGAGTDEAVVYKQKGQDVVEEEKNAEEAEPEPVVEMETIGVSIDDFLSGKTRLQRKEAREAEGIKGAKA